MNSGNQEQLTSSGGYAPQIDEGGRLFYVKKDQRGIWKLENREESLVLPDFDPTHYGAFALAKGRLYYLNAAERTISEFDMETGEAKALIRTRRPPRLGVTLSYSAAANVLLYAQVDHIDADIMMLVKQ